MRLRVLVRRGTPTNLCNRRQPTNQRVPAYFESIDAATSV